MSISTLNRTCSHERKVWLRVSWHHPLKFTSVFWGGRGAVDVELCTCAGRIRHTFPRSIAGRASSSHRLANKKKLHTPSRRDTEARPWDQSERVLGTTLTRSILPCALPAVIIHPRLTDLSKKKKKLSAATDPTYPNGSERKPRTHLLTSKGMVLFARFTGGFLGGKNATSNREPFSFPLCYRLFIGTGLTSA